MLKSRRSYSPGRRAKSPGHKPTKGVKIMSAQNREVQDLKKRVKRAEKEQRVAAAGHTPGLPLPPQKPKRAENYAGNVRGLFDPMISLSEFNKRVAGVREKYKNSSQRKMIEDRIAQAQKRRPSTVAKRHAAETALKMNGYPDAGVPLYKLLNTTTGVYEGDENKKVQVAPKYKLFEGDDFKVQKMTAENVQAYLAPPPPPPICAREIEQGIDPLTNPCFKSGLEQRLSKFLAKVNKGDFLCGVGGAELGGHQIVVREVAKMMAAKPASKSGDRRGLLVFHSTGSGKCHAYDTPILMYDGTIKKVQDVCVGDVVMGDDSGPRHVSSLGRGEEAMYDIVPTKKNAEKWGCNESHILVLKYTRHKTVTKTPHNTWCLHWHQGGGVFKAKNFKQESEALAFAATIPDELSIVEIEVEDYLLLKDHVKHVLKMFRTGVDFPDPSPPCFDPYVLGAWLGDGTSRCGQITTADVEIVSELQRRLEPYGMYIKAVAQKYQFSMTGDSRALIKALRSENLIQNKHIPHHIKTGSRQTRLEVLAGLLDTDGYLHGNCYEIIQKNKTLADDIVFVARSLGFAAYVNECRKGCWYKDEYRRGTYHRVSISGDGMEDIPVVLERKKAAPRQQPKDALRYGFDVVPTGWGDYYGFTVDGNHRYLLGDFTVSHNTVTAMGIMAEFWKTDKRIVFCTTIKNKSGNPPSEYARNCLLFYPDMAETVFGAALQTAPPRSQWTFKEAKTSGSPLEVWCAGPGKDAITKRVMYHSFWTLGSQERASGATTDAILKNNGKGSVLIMDESQNLFKPTDEREKKACKYLGEYLQQSKNLGHVIAFPLTATPGDTANEYTKMLNVVRSLGAKAMVPQDIVANPGIVRGLVSYADIRGDRTHYGHISDGSSTGPQDIMVPHTSKYFAAMLASFKGPTWSKEVRDLDKAPEGSTKKYFVYSRIGSCVLPATAVRTFYSPEELEALKARHQFVKVDNSQALLSEKMRVALERAAAMPGCQYMYVPDAKVLKAVSAALEGMQFGAVKVSTHLEDGKITITAPKKRFYAFHDGTVNGEKPTGDEMKKVLNFFKSEKNKHGEYIKIFVGTIYEGLDMAWLRGVHLCAPLPTKADDDQAVGRALRYCGHAADARSVAVYRYIGVAPKSLDLEAAGGKKMTAVKQKAIDGALKNLSKYDVRGINAFLRTDAERRAKPLSDFVACIQAQSVECGVLDAIQFGRKVTCGSTQCPVKLDAKGEPVMAGGGAVKNIASQKPSQKPSQKSQKLIPDHIGSRNTTHSGRDAKIGDHLSAKPAKTQFFATSFSAKPSAVTARKASKAPPPTLSPKLTRSLFTLLFGASSKKPASKPASSRLVA